ncbi:Hypothetical_protein [Hexamita inflata]|uniref:Hypothetical_protein n=1 Tax=Hexamita inflata TaxID=28002 RepID=A0AA86P6K5_9EUKA|nr:Hypothetical protein HINF_LOCUS19059 [Hexamita inflata]CAI9973145.1 Hypothetical protein HINF_LOCUS60790 [Hexamita inflata]
MQQKITSYTSKDNGNDLTERRKVIFVCQYIASNTDQSSSAVESIGNYRLQVEALQSTQYHLLRYFQILCHLEYRPLQLINLRLLIAVSDTRMQQNINALSYSMCSPCPRNLLEMIKIIMYDTQLYLAYTEQGILYVDAHQLLKCFKPNLKTSYDIKISTQLKRLTFVEIYENYNLPNRIIKTCIHLLNCNDNKFTTIPWSSIEEKFVIDKSSSLRIRNLFPTEQSLLIACVKHILNEHHWMRRLLQKLALHNQKLLHIIIFKQSDKITLLYGYYDIQAKSQNSRI